MLQGDGVTRDEACGRRLAGGQHREPILGVEVLDQWSAVPRFVCHHEAVPFEDGARQHGQAAGDLRDSGAGGRGQSDAGLL